MTARIRSKSLGLIQIPLLIGLLLLAVAIPVATNLVQQNQENRGKAAADIPCGQAGSGCYLSADKKTGYKIGTGEKVDPNTGKVITATTTAKAGTNKIETKGSTSGRAGTTTTMGSATAKTGSSTVGGSSMGNAGATTGSTTANVTTVKTKLDYTATNGSGQCAAGNTGAMCKKSDGTVCQVHRNTNCTTVCSDNCGKLSGKCAAGKTGGACKCGDGETGSLSQSSDCKSTCTCTKVADAITEKGTFCYDSKGKGVACPAAAPKVAVMPAAGQAAVGQSTDNSGSGVLTQTDEAYLKEAIDSVSNGVGTSGVKGALVNQVNRCISDLKGQLTQAGITNCIASSAKTVLKIDATEAQRFGNAVGISAGCVVCGINPVCLSGCVAATNIVKSVSTLVNGSSPVSGSGVLPAADAVYLKEAVTAASNGVGTAGVDGAIKNQINRCIADLKGGASQAGISNCVMSSLKTNLKIESTVAQRVGTVIVQNAGCAVCGNAVCFASCLDVNKAISIISSNDTSGVVSTDTTSTGKTDNVASMKSPAAKTPATTAAPLTVVSVIKVAGNIVSNLVKSGFGLTVTQPSK